MLLHFDTPASPPPIAPGEPRLLESLTPDDVQKLFQAAYQEPPRPDARITIGPRAISIREREQLCLYIQVNGQVEAYFDEPRKPVAELDVFALVAALNQLHIQFAKMQ